MESHKWSIKGQEWGYVWLVDARESSGHGMITFRQLSEQEKARSGLFKSDKKATYGGNYAQ